MILCCLRIEVTPAQREAFGAAQARWPALSRERAFLGRFGGWDANATAWIFELWRDAEGWREVRRRAWPGLAEVAGLASWYQRAEPTPVQVMLAMPGAVPTTEEALRAGRLLRVVQARVAPSRRHELMDAQVAIWRPAMAGASGMLGGYFGARADEPLCYVGASLWRSAAEHDRWAEVTAPELRSRNDLDRLVLDLQGERIELDPRWTVARAPGQAAAL